MKTLLRIDSSSRTKGSHSRGLADYFEEKWRQKHPNGEVIYRDLIKNQLPHLQNNTIEGFYTPTESFTEETKKATALSSELIAELKQSDELLISSPLYNFNVPSNLKAYIDQIVRVGYTFDTNENGYYGLLKNKKAFIISVKGGVYKNTFMEKYDFQEPYFKAILGYLGIEIGTLFSLEGTGDKTILEENTRKIHKQIDMSFKNRN